MAEKVTAIVDHVVAKVKQCPLHMYLAAAFLVSFQVALVLFVIPTPPMHVFYGVLVLVFVSGTFGAATATALVRYYDKGAAKYTVVNAKEEEEEEMEQNFSP
jgi:hypothetical protein